MSQDNSYYTLEDSQVNTWRSQFFKCPLNRLAQNICTAGDPISACRRQEPTALAAADKEHYGVAKVVKSTVGGPNWICMGLDMLRLAMSKDCELSAAYLFYWHKLERCNYFLNSVVDLLACCEPLDGRTFQYLMKHTVPDGGNWQMFVNLVQKYGVMPQKCYLAGWSSTRALHLNRILRSKLHEFSSRLHAQFTFDGNAQQLAPMVKAMAEEIYKVISICLGTPPEEFPWNTKDDKKLLTFTPLSFYERMVAPYYALDAQVCLGHDPRRSSSYQRNYRVAFSSNMINGLQHSYNNQPMDVLLRAIVASIAAGSPVWLACDLQLIYKGKQEVLGLTTHNFEHVFGMDVGTVLSKADRLLYKDTRRNTVMLLTEVILDGRQQPLQFRTIRKAEAEGNNKTKSNSSLPVSVDSEKAKKEKDAAKKKSASGKATVLNVDWLREFGFEIVVESQFVPSGVLHALRAKPSVELPAWDPMGALLG